MTERGRTGRGPIRALHRSSGRLAHVGLADLKVLETNVEYLFTSCRFDKLTKAGEALAQSPAFVLDFRETW